MLYAEQKITTLPTLTLPAEPFLLPYFFVLYSPFLIFSYLFISYNQYFLLSPSYLTISLLHLFHFLKYTLCKSTIAFSGIFSNLLDMKSQIFFFILYIILPTSLLILSTSIYYIFLFHQVTYHLIIKRLASWEIKIFL